MYVLALDVGTTFVQAAVLETESGKVIGGGLARAEFAVSSSSPETAEIPWEGLWQALAQAARTATRHAPEVEAVGMAGWAPGLVLVNHQDQPGRPIHLPRDRRARPAARQVDAVVGAEMLATTGQRPIPGAMTAITYRQLLFQDPYVAHEIKSFLHVNGWLGLHLTGERGFDPYNASCTGLYNTLTDRTWSPRWCDYFEIEPAWLPKVRPASDTLGTVRSAVAAEIGVPPGIPVKVGAASIVSAMLAVDMKPGDLWHAEGNTQLLAVLADSPRPDPKRFIRHLERDRFIYVTHNPVGGAALNWLKELCFREQSEEEFFTRTLAEAQARATRVQFDPPFLSGDPMEIEARRASVRDLELSSDRLDVLAGFLSALSRRHQEALAALEKSDPVGAVFWTGTGVQRIKPLLYPNAEVQEFDNGSLFGIARLFAE
jgi:xylulokinase